MPGDDRELRTAAGREVALTDHERRIDVLEDRVAEIKGKEEGRDKRWDLIVKALVTIGGGIIIAVASALIAGGTVHP
jgi:hypothetical protein